MILNSLERMALRHSAQHSSAQHSSAQRQLGAAWLRCGALRAVTLVAIFAMGAAAVAADGADARQSKQRKPKRSGDKFEEITFDDLKLDLQKDEPFSPEKLTERVKELDKQAIRIRGYILPASVFQQKDIPNFVLVRDNMECCFGPGAALHDSMIIEMESGKTTDFTTRPVTVEGVFQVKEFKYPDGKYYAIYHLRGSSVK